LKETKKKKLDEDEEIKTKDLPNSKNAIKDLLEIKKGLNQRSGATI
jgi:hypothetical protein